MGVPYIKDAGEIFIICAAIAGSGLGFLWFNTYPAQVFMGDVGALSLGAALGLIAVIIRQEVVLAVMGGVFILEIVLVCFVSPPPQFRARIRRSKEDINRISSFFIVIFIVIAPLIF